MNVKKRCSLEPGKEKESKVSPNCFIKSSAPGPANSRLSPYEQTKSLSCNGTEIQPLGDGGLSIDTTKPFNRETLSTRPLSIILNPEGANKDAQTSVRSVNNVLTKSIASAGDISFLLISEACARVRSTSGEDSTGVIKKEMADRFARY